VDSALRQQRGGMTCKPFDEEDIDKKPKK